MISRMYWLCVNWLSVRWVVQYSSKRRGAFHSQNLVHLWQKSFYFHEKSIKNPYNPFVLTKSRTLFPMSEVSLGKRYTTLVHTLSSDFSVGEKTLYHGKFSKARQRPFIGVLLKYCEKMFCDCCNKGRFCNTIASVALVHTSIQSD